MTEVGTVTNTVRVILRFMVNRRFLGYGKSDVSGIEGKGMYFRPSGLIAVSNLPCPRALERRVLDIDRADPSDRNGGNPANERVARYLFRRYVGIR